MSSLEDESVMFHAEGESEAVRTVYDDEESIDFQEEGNGSFWGNGSSGFRSRSGSMAKHTTSVANPHIPKSPMTSPSGAAAVQQALPTVHEATPPQQPAQQQQQYPPESHHGLFSSLPQADTLKAVTPVYNNTETATPVGGHDASDLTLSEDTTAPRAPAHVLSDSGANSDSQPQKSPPQPEMVMVTPSTTRTREEPSSHPITGSTPAYGAMVVIGKPSPQQQPDTAAPPNQLVRATSSSRAQVKPSTTQQKSTKKKTAAAASPMKVLSTTSTKRSGQSSHRMVEQRAQAQAAHNEEEELANAQRVTESCRQYNLRQQKELLGLSKTVKKEKSLYTSNVNRDVSPLGAVASYVRGGGGALMPNGSYAAQRSTSSRARSSSAPSRRVQSPATRGVASPRVITDAVNSYYNDMSEQRRTPRQMEDDRMEAYATRKRSTHVVAPRGVDVIYSPSPAAHNTPRGRPAAPKQHPSAPFVDRSSAYERVAKMYGVVLPKSPARKFKNNGSHSPFATSRSPRHKLFFSNGVQLTDDQVEKFMESCALAMHDHLEAPGYHHSDPAYSDSFIPDHSPPKRPHVKFQSYTHAAKRGDSEETWHERLHQEGRMNAFRRARGTAADGEDPSRWTRTAQPKSRTRVLRDVFNYVDNRRRGNIRLVDLPYLWEEIVHQGPVPNPPQTQDEITRRLCLEDIFPLLRDSGFMEVDFPVFSQLVLGVMARAPPGSVGARVLKTVEKLAVTYH